MKKTKLRNSQGFVQGAFIIMFANILVKIIGALFKIPLTNIIGEEAMGYFQSTYSIFTTFFIISTAGLPVAMSRMVAAADAKGDQRGVRQIFRVSMLVFLALGIVGTGIMAAISRLIEQLSMQPGLHYSLWALAPTLFFIGITSAFRGYFQGKHNMIPTALSQVIEALGKLVLGLLFANLALSLYPDEPYLWAGAAILGVTIGVVFSTIYLSLSKAFLHKNEERISLSAPDVQERSNGAVLRELVRIAIPITVAAVVINLTSNIDVFTIVPILSGYLTGPFAEKIANTLYGTFSVSVTLFNLVPALTQAFSISIIPSISAALAKGEKSSAHKTMDTALKMVSCIALPASLGMLVLSRPIIDLLYHTRELQYSIGNDLKGTIQGSAGVNLTNVDIAAPCLAILSIAIFLAALYSTTGSILQASGYEKKSIYSAIIGILTKLIGAVALIHLIAGLSLPNAYLGILGAALSTMLSYLVMLLCNFYFLHKHVKYRPKVREFFLTPLIASVLCAAVAFGLYTGLNSLGHGKLALLVAILGAVLVYFVTLLLIGGVKREDFAAMPKGEKIAKILTKLKLLK